MVEDELIETEDVILVEEERDEESTGVEEGDTEELKDVEIDDDGDTEGES